MKSDGGILYHEPARPLWVPRAYATRPQRLAVRYKTQLCDGQGRVIKDLQHGWNEITDWGMDAVAGIRQETLINYLHLSDTLGTAKRVASGGTTLTLTSVADPTNVPVESSAGFFLAGDVGNTLSIDALGQELKITGYTDSQHVTCATRPGVWLPDVTPTTGPFAAYGVHFTSVNTLANQFTKFNTFDTSAVNYNAELNDSGNSRFIQQRIFLSGAAGTDWTINQLGWSDGNVGNNVFGKVNLASPDLVGTGQKYRVQLQLYSVYTPVDIASQSVNWGATIGTYDLQIREEIVPKDSGFGNFLKPYLTGTQYTGWSTAAFTMYAIKWEGDVGYNPNQHAPAAQSSSNDVTTAAYTNGTHKVARTWKVPDDVNVTAATGIFPTDSGSPWPQRIALKPNSGTITKATGYWAALTFQIYWTRAFTN